MTGVSKEYGGLNYKSNTLWVQDISRIFSRCSVLLHRLSSSPSPHELWESRSETTAKKKKKRKKRGWFKLWVKLILTSQPSCRSAHSSSPGHRRAGAPRFHLGRLHSLLLVSLQHSANQQENRWGRLIWRPRLLPPNRMKHLILEGLMRTGDSRVCG